MAEDDDYPPEQQESDRRMLEWMDRERAAGREVRIPGAVVSAVVGGLHPIRAWREYRAISQHGLATAAGMDQATIEAMESRQLRPSVQEIEAIAGALECPPIHLSLDQEDRR